MTEKEPEPKESEIEDAHNVTQENEHQNQETQQSKKTPEQEQVVEDQEEEEVEMVEIAKSRLEELTSAEEKFMEELKRERAESINYRKKLQKQRDEYVEFASSGVLTKLLAVKDDLRRIVENIREDEVPHEHYEALNLLEQRVEGIFQQEGVSLIKVDEGKTRYDPNFHEAVVAQPFEDLRPNTIVEVISQGFRKGNRVLRPTKVVISKKPPGPKPEVPETDDNSTIMKSENDSSEREQETSQDKGSKETVEPNKLEGE